MPRHTKIVATLGPASDNPEVVDELVLAGVDVFRLNFSHGTHESHARSAERIRAAARKADHSVAILQDLSGPKIRTGRLAGGRPVVLTPGARLRIEIGDGEGEPGRVFTEFEGLATSVSAGDRLLLDDGRIELEVVAAAARGVDTVVVNGGTLGEQKGINAPGVPLAGSALTPKDRADLEYGVRLGVDFVAMSFVQRAQDVIDARSALEAAGAGALPIIAKIERPAALECIDQILDVCDGIMVARGDLGLEVPLERVPRIQKDLTRRARARGLPVIVATQVLESMRQEPRPTRAEVSDAANAVDQGVDAIMLAGETAVGHFPVRAVRTLDVIIREAETLPQVEPPPPGVGPEQTDYSRAICEAAITLAERSAANAIVAVTRRGKTARWLSMLRPTSPIYGATDNEAVARRLALSWGVVPVVCTVGDVTVIQRELTASSVLVSGAVVVFVSVSPDLSRTDANFLNLQKLP
jgi:pyruvate kinase